MGRHMFLAFFLNSIWQICLTTAAAYGCSILLRRAHARITHLLWVIALVASTLLPVLSLGAVDGGRANSQLQRWSSMNQFRKTIGNSIWEDGQGSPGLGTGNAFPMATSGFMAAYCLLLGYRIILLWLRWKRTQQAIKAAEVEVVPERIRMIADQFKQLVGVRSVVVGCSATSVVPFGAGVFKPVVVLPFTLLEPGSDDELCCAIGHELAHIRRRDYLLNLGYEVFSLPFAFHPCIAWMKRQIAKSREAACDEIAALALGNSTVYARALVNLARTLPQPPLARLANSPALGVLDANNLEERVMQLLDKTPRLGAQRAAVMLAFGLLLLFATCVVGYSSALTPEHNASPAQTNLNGVWTGGIEERTPEGVVKGRSSLYLRLQEDAGKLSGVVGDTEAAASPVENAALQGSHLKFSAVAAGGPKGSVTWTLDLDVKGDEMSGKGHAFRAADKHSWDADVRLSRNK